jgi:hypothetical protein
MFEFYDLKYNSNVKINPLFIIIYSIIYYLIMGVLNGFIKIFFLIFFFEFRFPFKPKIKFKNSKFNTHSKLFMMRYIYSN